MHADDLDHAPYLRLGVAQVQSPAGDPQAAGHHREIQHQRAVGERQLAQVHDHVGPRGEGARHGRSAASLRRDVLVAAAPEHGGLFVERNDARKLYSMRG